MPAALHRQASWQVGERGDGSSRDPALMQREDREGARPCLGGGGGREASRGAAPGTRRVERRVRGAWRICKGSTLASRSWSEEKGSAIR